MAGNFLKLPHQKKKKRNEEGKKAQKSVLCVVLSELTRRIYERFAVVSGCSGGGDYKKPV